MPLARRRLPARAGRNSQCLDEAFKPFKQGPRERTEPKATNVLPVTVRFAFGTRWRSLSIAEGLLAVDPEVDSVGGECLAHRL